jgi:hypothetical protein
MISSMNCSGFKRHDKKDGSCRDEQRKRLQQPQRSHHRREDQLVSRMGCAAAGSDVDERSSGQVALTLVNRIDQPCGLKRWQPNLRSRWRA